MNKFRINRILAGGLIALTVGISYYINHKNVEKKHLIIETASEFSGLLNDFFLNAGSVYITVNKSFYQILNTRNLKLKPQDLGDFLQKGDSITKSKGSNYVIICRDGKGYYFHIYQGVHSKDPDICPQSE
jgi:hypothetical protein